MSSEDMWEETAQRLDPPMRYLTRSASKSYEQAHQEIQASAADNSHRPASLDLAREAAQRLDPPIKRLKRSDSQRYKQAHQEIQASAADNVKYPFP
jgi:hypothetical protein